jgi:hypothetical protein
MQTPNNVIEMSVEQSTKTPARSSSFAAASAAATASAFSYSSSFVESPEFAEFSARAITAETLMHELAQARAEERDEANQSANELANKQPDQVSSQWHIEQYELQHALQNATKNYVCTPLQSMEALYVEQFKKMSRRETVLKEVPVAETNRFDVSSQLKLNDEETNSLDELVKAFRTRKLQRVAVLRKNQTVCEESLRSQCRYMLRWFKNYVTSRLQDTVAEVAFALKLLCLYTN